jgi:hypothetical protein
MAVKVLSVETVANAKGILSLPSSGALLVHSSLQMRYASATESSLNLLKTSKWV